MAVPASLDDDREHKTVRLTYRLGSNEYWGVQMTDWEDAPALSGANLVRNIGGRRFELHYNGPHLHMVVLRTDSATYWIVNTLLDRLSNETMLAIAKIPNSSSTNAVSNVSDTGKWLSAWTSPTCFMSSRAFRSPTMNRMW